MRAEYRWQAVTEMIRLSPHTKQLLLANSARCMQANRHESCIKDSTMQCNMREARNQLSKLVQAALAGEDVVIANKGVPVVRLVKVCTQQFARANPVHGRACQKPRLIGIHPRPMPPSQRYSPAANCHEMT